MQSEPMSPVYVCVDVWAYMCVTVSVCLCIIVVAFGVFYCCLPCACIRTCIRVIEW